MKTPYRTLIDVDALHRARSQGEPMVIFDCETDLADPNKGLVAHREGHVPSARHLDLAADLSGPCTGRNGRHPLPDPAVFAATLRSHGVNDGDQVVAYDASGGPYAARLWWLLRWIGHDAVAVLDGGKAAWVRAGLPLETGATPAAAQPGNIQVRGSLVARPVDAEHVIHNLSYPTQLVLDARSPERFRGEPNPLDPVPGHIPGARNRFFKDNLDTTGRFKPPDQLAREFREVLVETPPEEVILQCGSGVTACHNALAMSVAGLDGARLYPGSWSEWITDASRPVARSVA
jgi:thiosulfate/3-mercaptopyruvate sulfurtransferase